MVTPSPRAMWMKTGEATASPLCFTGPAWFLWRSPKTEPPSTELDRGSQVAHPQPPATSPQCLKCRWRLFYFWVAIVHSGKLDAKFKAAMGNSTQWQYYGTPKIAGTLEMTWSPSLVRADKVNIELWGYRETGGSTWIYIETWWSFVSANAFTIWSPEQD